MRHLMLLRHAKTERDSPTGNDRDRRLNARGREDAPTLGRYLAAHRIVPQCVLVSPATRARDDLGPPEGRAAEHAAAPDRP